MSNSSNNYARHHSPRVEAALAFTALTLGFLAFQLLDATDSATSRAAPLQATFALASPDWLIDLAHNLPSNSFIGLILFAVLAWNFLLRLSIDKTTRELAAERDRLEQAVEARTAELCHAQAQLAAHNSNLERLVARRTSEVVAVQDTALFALAKLADSRDSETGGHLMRIRAYSQILAEELAANSPYAAEIDAQFLDDLYRSSPLHDIGKVGIADAILLKCGQLTPEEFEIMKRHTVIGANALDQVMYNSEHAGFLAMASVIARFHHERFDGSGYFAGLAGLEIPLAARIVSVADVFDALISKRTYKDAYPLHEARQYIVDQSGRHFDPVIVDAFLARFDDLAAIRDSIEDKAPSVCGASALLGALAGLDPAAI